MFAGTSLGRDSVISIPPRAKGVGYDWFYILYLPNKATAVEEVFQVMADSSWNMVLVSHRIFRTYMFCKRQTTLYNVLDLQRQIYCRIYCVLHTYNMHIITCSPFDVYSKWLWCVLLPQLWTKSTSTNCYNLPLWCQLTDMQCGLSKHWSRNLRSFRSDLAVSCTRKRFGELFLAISSCDKLCIWFKNVEKLTNPRTPRLLWCFRNMHGTNKHVIMCSKWWGMRNNSNTHLKNISWCFTFGSGAGSAGARLPAKVKAATHKVRWFGDPIFSRFGHPCQPPKKNLWNLEWKLLWQEVC